MNRIYGFFLAALVTAGFLAGHAHAQAQFFRVNIENTGQPYSYVSSGVFNTPDGAAMPGPAVPGDSYSIEFDAAPGSHLSFVTMFVESNDLFYAPGDTGLPLWENGSPRTADVTQEIMLWDAGTELNEEPGVGPNQVMRQSGPDTGPADGNVNVRLVNDEYTYPDVADVVSVMLEHLDGSRFRLTISNVSDGTTLMTSAGDKPVPVSPGVFVVHGPSDSPLFDEGMPDYGDGLEAIAEDGDPSSLGSFLEADTGVTPLFSPGAWAVHADGRPIFEVDRADPGDGLEAIAEDGAAGMLASTFVADATLSGDAFAVPVGSDAPGPLMPGASYEFTVVAAPGDRLSLATMYVQSNDLFVAPGETGIALFDGSGVPVSGSVTELLDLWDAGTEVNQTIGVGADQAPRQENPDSGAPDPDNFVRLAGLPDIDLDEILDVRVEPIESVSLMLTIENVSTPSTLMTSGGAESAVPLAPGVFTVHASGRQLFESGEPGYGRGLESLAEDGDPSGLATALSGQAGILHAAFNTPVGAFAPAPIGPGERYEFTFDAAPGARLSVATMFVPSNDLFFAPSEDGLALWDESGMLRMGDVTSEFMLWDAGTEMNQEPGAGDNQAPNQAAPDTGPADPDATVRLVNDGYTYPAVDEVIRITLSEATGTASESALSELPTSVRLHQNYPNPFNPQTTIRFDVDVPGYLRLTVVDLLGRTVATLVERPVEAGTHGVTWDGTDSGGRTVSSGVYLIRLTAVGEFRTRTMTLLK